VKFDAKTIVVLLFLGFVWGSAFILMKRGLVSFDAMQLASLRLVFAGSVAVFFFVKHIKVPSKKDWQFLALSGTIGNFIPAYLFASAGAQMPSSLSGALNALTPIFALIAGVILFAQLFSIKQFIGIMIGLFGALMLILSKSKTGFTFETAYIEPCLKVLVAAVLYGINVNIIKSKLNHLSPIVNSMMPLTMIAVPAFFIGLFYGAHAVIINQPQSHNALLYILVLGVIGSAGSLIVFNQLVQKTTALFAASVTYLIPVFAYMWGMFDGEPIGLFQLAGMGCILGGITLTKK
jgi:drug/metabolite transporter (DMT)-like permease